MTRVLLVDDEETLLRLLARVLRRHGFEVTTATNGEAALESVAVAPPDVVLSDVRMPSVDGPTLLKQLRARGIRTPVVFLTGFASHSDDGLLALGASAVFGKPVQVETLVEALRKLSA